MFCLSCGETPWQSEAGRMAVPFDGINLCVRCWFKNEDFWQGKWRITEQCKYALDKAEIEIPFPQMDVHMR